MSDIRLGLNDRLCKGIVWLFRASCCCLAYDNVRDIRTAVHQIDEARDLIWDEMEASGYDANNWPAFVISCAESAAEHALEDPTFPGVGYVGPYPHFPGVGEDPALYDYVAGVLEGVDIYI